MRRPFRASLRPALDLDLAIVGGGPAGVATALFLVAAAPRLARSHRHPREGALPAREDLRRRDRRARGPPARDASACASTSPPSPCAASPSSPRAARSHAATAPRRGPSAASSAASSSTAPSPTTARARGVRVLEGARVTEPRLRRRAASASRPRAGELRARAVVGADGVGSFVRRALGAPRGRWLAQVVEVDTPARRRAIPRATCSTSTSPTRSLLGYAWDFPTVVAGEPLVCRGVYELRPDPGAHRGDARPRPTWARACSRASTRLGVPRRVQAQALRRARPLAARAARAAARAPRRRGGRHRPRARRGDRAGHLLRRGRGPVPRALPRARRPRLRRLARASSAARASALDLRIRTARDALALRPLAPARRALGRRLARPRARGHALLRGRARAARCASRAPALALAGAWAARRCSRYFSAAGLGGDVEPAARQRGELEDGDVARVVDALRGDDRPLDLALVVLDADGEVRVLLAAGGQLEDEGRPVRLDLLGRRSTAGSPRRIGRSCRPARRWPCRAASILKVTIVPVSAARPRGGGAWRCPSSPSSSLEAGLDPKVSVISLGSDLRTAGAAAAAPAWAAPRPRPLAPRPTRRGAAVGGARGGGRGRGGLGRLRRGRGGGRARRTPRGAGRRIGQAARRERRRRRRHAFVMTSGVRLRRGAGDQAAIRLGFHLAR